MKKGLLLVVCIMLIIVSTNAQKPNKDSKKVKPVLIVMDIQNEYLPHMDQDEAELALEYINAYIALFRNYNFPVITVYHQRKNGIPHQDSLDFQFPETINILPDDPRVIKNYPSAFTKTNLHNIIEKEGGNTLFICGLSAKGCALATYMAANDYEYEAFLIKNAIISDNSEQTDQIEDMFGAVNYGIVKVLLEGL